MEQSEQAKACLKEIEEVLAKYNFNLVPTIQLFEAPAPVEQPEEDVVGEPTEVEGEVVG